jgi:hypothetical protein
MLIGTVQRVVADTPPPLTVETVKYKGWPNCIHISNGQVELIATTDVGPRVIRFGFVSGASEFHEFPADSGKTGGTTWRSYGGHRLWESPAANPRSYQPDNGSIQAVMEGDSLHLTQPTEQATGIQKEMIVTMDRSSPHVRVLHRLTNRGLWPVTLAAWALTVMETGGRAIIPLAHRNTKDSLLPNRALVLWPYTDTEDTRFTLGKHYALVQQDMHATRAFKIGVTAYDGWVAYVRKGHLFLKRFTTDQTAVYPDYGASAETYSASDFQELETVGPLRELQPKESVEHVEDWYLFQNVDAQDEAAIDRTVLPFVQSTGM